jgi:hypothetical protein
MFNKEKQPGRCNIHDDEWVQGFRKFFARYRKADTSGNRKTLRALETSNPGLYYAHQIHIRAFEHPEEAFMLRCRILSGQTDETIAADRHTLPETIQWYEKIYFNVRDRINAQDWIVREVLYPVIVEAETNGKLNTDQDTYVPARRELVEPLFDPRIMWFSYFFGAIAVDFAMTGFFRNARPKSQEDIGNALESFVRNALGRVSAMGVHAVPINKYNVTEILAVFGQFLSIAKADSDEEQKQSMLEKSVNAMLTDMPWAVGDRGALLVANTAVEQFDNSPVELRSDQLLQLSAGEDIPAADLAEIQRRMKGLPEAPESDEFDQRQENVSNANT